MKLRIFGGSFGLPGSVALPLSALVLSSACSERDVSLVGAAPSPLTPSPAAPEAAPVTPAVDAPSPVPPGPAAPSPALPEPVAPAAGEGTSSEPGPAQPAPLASQPALYALGTLVFGAEGTSSYVRLLDSLSPGSVSLDQAREFAGTADLWVHDGQVFVAEGESLRVTKFAVEAGQLVPVQSLSFAAYGLTSLGFWLNRFVGPSKAYLFNGASEAIVWNPASMEITGTVRLPALPAPRAGLTLTNGYSDRSAVVRDGRLYQPLYWADETFFEFGPRSAIAVIDVASDSLLATLDAPCPGLDYATQAENGDIYFSSWIFAAGGAAVLAQPPTCVVRLPASSDEPELAFRFAELTQGREGAALRYLSGGRALLSVLHDERVPMTSETDPAAVTYAANWRFWLYDQQSASASPIESIDWHAGAQYSFDIDGRTLMLVAESDYSATTVYDVGNGSAPARLFDTPGWSVRLFKLR